MSGPLVKAHIDLDVVRRNVAALRGLIPADCRFMAVVKADGYGHGAQKTARAALDAGAEWLGVARLEEALPLREAGISVPLLIFGYIHPEQVWMAAAQDLTITVYNFEMARLLSQALSSKGMSADVHLKIDTGMGRVGMIVDRDLISKDIRNQRIREIGKIAGLPGMRLKGVYTHFADADSSDKAYTHRQMNTFDSLLADLKNAGLEFELRHAANSAGIIAHPASHYDMVRAGISLYGLPPSDEVDLSNVTLTPAMTLTSMITSVREVPKGFCVSYGMTHRTEQPTRLASVPIGYADGFSRHFSSNGHMLVRGIRAPIVGRVCMDQTIIDVGGIKDAAMGDDVIIIGGRGNETITADELAKSTGTINYEIVSVLTPRVERVYTGEPPSKIS